MLPDQNLPLTAAFGKQGYSLPASKSLTSFSLELTIYENTNGIYQGQTDNLKRKNGRGIFLWDTGDIYSGRVAYLHAADCPRCLEGRYVGWPWLFLLRIRRISIWDLLQ